MELPTPGLAVSLGSSFLGYYAHAGFLNGLAAAGLHPQRVAGASAGAIAGALYSSGLRGHDLKSTALDASLRWSFFDWGVLYRLPGICTSFWSSGLFSGKRAAANFHRLFQGADLSSLEPPLEIAVTDADRHLPEIRREGPLAKLIVASCAVPGLIGMQKINGRRYIDGGVACEAPFEHWLDDPEIHTIVIHRIRHEENSGPTVSWETIATSIGASHHTVCNELHRHRTALAKAKGKRLIEIETLTPMPGLLTQRRAPRCYDQGFLSGRSVLL